jgi:hypothetical protein
MLFQNSCVVPLGITAMVNFFPSAEPGGPERLQPRESRIMEKTKNVTNATRGLARGPFRGLFKGFFNGLYRGE